VIHVPLLSAAAVNRSSVGFFSHRQYCRPALTYRSGLTDKAFRRQGGRKKRLSPRDEQAGIVVEGIVGEGTGALKDPLSPLVK
jgi:hypothetical protein